MTPWRNVLIVLVGALALVAAACGDDDDNASGEASTDTAASEDEAPLQNACPADGCEIRIVNVISAGDELEVEFDLNFAPDVDNNHIHIYWDTYSAAQVSGDASDRGEEQGEWVPTDSVPTYVTDGVVSTGARQDSTTLCVVAADRDHNVLNVETEQCTSVADLL